MAQIGIDTLCRKGISFAVDIVNMRAREDHIQIAIVPICAICPSFWSCIHHLLDRLCGFVRTHRVSHDLPRMPADHRHNIHIFASFSLGLAFNIPVELIQFCNLWIFFTGFPLLNFPLGALFLGVATSRVLCLWRFRGFESRLPARSVRSLSAAGRRSPPKSPTTFEKVDETFVFWGFIKRAV